MSKRIVLSLIVVGTIFVSIISGSPAIAAEKQLTFGYIMPGPDPWYGYAKDGFLFAAEKRGVKVIVVNSNYDQEKELANIDDLITQKVDGINLFSFNPDGAQIAAQKANADNIPLTIEMSALAEGPGEIVSDIEFDWAKLGTMMAEYLAETHPGAPSRARRRGSRAAGVRRGSRRAAGDRRRCAGSRRRRGRAAPPRGCSATARPGRRRGSRS